MFKKILLVVMGIVVFLFIQNSNATLVEITVDTDKDVYDLGEEVFVYVTAYNPNTEPVTLNFAISLHASYLLDGLYEWINHQYYFPVATSLTIESEESFMWTLKHGIDEMATYPLEQGTHTIVGKVLAVELASYTSIPIEFEVLPEPATVLFVGTGAFLLFKKRRFFRAENSTTS